MIRLDPNNPKDRAEIFRIIRSEMTIDEISEESFLNEPCEVLSRGLRREIVRGNLRLVIQEIKL